MFYIPSGIAWNQQALPPTANGDGIIFIIEWSHSNQAYQRLLDDELWARVL